MIATSDPNQIAAAAALFREADLRSGIPACSNVEEARGRWDERFEAVLDRAIQPAPTIARAFPEVPPDALRTLHLADRGWACIVGPRVNTTTGKRWCYLEEWRADPGSCDEMLDAVAGAWTAPSDGIKLHARTPPPSSRVQAQVEAVCADWSAAPPNAPEPGGALRRPNVIEPWWDDFASFADVEPPGRGRDEERAHMATLAAAGTVLNLVDADGLLAHVSWEASAYDDLLIPECWHINHVAVRPDARERGVAIGLLALAARTMDLESYPIVCALVRAGNTPSLRMFARAGMPVALTYFVAG